MSECLIVRVTFIGYKYEVMNSNYCVRAGPKLPINDIIFMAKLFSGSALTHRNVLRKVGLSNHEATTSKLAMLCVNRYKREISFRYMKLIILLKSNGKDENSTFSKVANFDLL